MGKANINVDALLRVSWPICVPYTSWNLEPAHTTLRWMAKAKDSALPLLICWGCCLQNASPTGKVVLECWYMCTMAPKNATTGFSPYFLMYGKQPQLPINVTLRISPKLIATPTSSKFIKKLMDHIKWASKKADLFQWKKCNTISDIMTNAARQCPWGQGTWSWSMSPPSRTGIKFRADGRTGSMWWNSSPNWTYQCMWCVPQMGKARATTCTEITCCPWANIWNMENVKILWGWWA